MSQSENVKWRHRRRGWRTVRRVLPLKAWRALRTQGIGRAERREVLFTAVFVQLLLAQFCYGTAYSTQFVLPKYLIDELSAPATLVGGAHGMFNVAALLAVPLVGRWLDTLGRKRVLLAGQLLGIVSFAPLGWVEQGSLVLSLRFLHGVSFALTFSAGQALAVDLAPQSRRAEAVGYYGSAMLITNGFGPLVAEVLAERLGWSAVFVACSGYAALALAAAVSMGLPGTASGQGRVQRSPVSWPLLGAYLSMVAIGFSIGACKTFGPAAMVEEGVERVAPYFFGFTLGAIIVRFGFGALPDKLGHLAATRGALWAHAASLVLLFATPANWMFWPAVALGLGHGVAYPASAALTAALAPEVARGRAMAWLAGCFNLGFAMSSMGLAPLEPYVGYRALLLIAAGVVAACAVAVPPLAQARRPAADSS